ncbi:glycoside hydrolase superfamily [Nemania sp. FL0031]|nr:glycoside hydrolase superfamily [Nemania sp. FL0031]
MYPVAFLTALVSAASAAKLGFNYGSTFTTGAAKMQSDFEAEFTTAANLKGTSGWTSARLYTMVQGGTASDPISAIPAAIKTKTTLLLGLWASAGDAAFANEITALKAAIEQYGSDFAGIVDGISIGSEDLYRNSPQGIAAGSNPGADPDVLVKYIKQVKDSIAGTVLEGALLGHVDTWTGWDNSSSSVVVDELDWIGMDAYPYFQDTMPNAIGQSKSLFQAALDTTQGAAGGKPVWVTETGQPVSGKTSGDSVASVENAETFWKTVGCPMFGNINVWWYTLQDAAPDTPNPSFGIVGSTLTTTPLFDLSCTDADADPPSSSSTSSTSAAKPSTTKGGVTSTTSGAGSTSTSTSEDGQGDVSNSQTSTEEFATGSTTVASVPTTTGAASSSSTGSSSSPSPSSGSSSSSDSGSSATSDTGSSGSPSGSSGTGVGTSASASSTPSATSSNLPDSAATLSTYPGTLGVVIFTVFIAFLAL